MQFYINNRLTLTLKMEHHWCKNSRIVCCLPWDIGSFSLTSHMYLSESNPIPRSLISPLCMLMCTLADALRDWGVPESWAMTRNVKYGRSVVSRDRSVLTDNIPESDPIEKNLQKECDYYTREVIGIYNDMPMMFKNVISNKIHSIPELTSQIKNFFNCW